MKIQVNNLLMNKDRRKHWMIMLWKMRTKKFKLLEVKIKSKLSCSLSKLLKIRGKHGNENRDNQVFKNDHLTMIEILSLEEGFVEKAQRVEKIILEEL